jgi:hypothetical protein
MHSYKKIMMTMNCVVVFLTVAALVADSPAAAYLRPGSRGSSQERKQRLRSRYLKTKADRIYPTFVQQLNAGVSHTASVEQEIDDQESGTCNVSGSVTYSISKISELHTRQGTTTLQALQDERNRENTLWLLTTTFDSFIADMTAQVLGKHCGRAMDFTSFGQVAVGGATVTATLQLLGPSHRPQVVDMVDVEQHHVAFEKSSSTFSKLIQRIHLETVERDINDFIHSLFTTEFQAIVEGELAKSS